MNPTRSLWKFATFVTLATTTLLLRAEPDSAQVVKRELDANGVFFNYMDFEEGWGKVASDINLALKDTPWKDRDFVALADALGLSQVRALGMSSTSSKDGYDNRIFLYTPGGRKGLLALFPGEPAAFEGARYAPADTDFFAEARLDVAAVVSAVTQIANNVTSDRELATQALEMLRKDPLGYGALLDFKGRVVALVRLHSHEELMKTKAEPSAKLPLDVFFRTDGGGAVVLKALAKEDDWKREDSGGRVFFTSTKDKTDIVVIVEGETVTAGSPRAFVEECLVRKDGLAQSAAFKQALASTAQKGHAVCYITPRVISEARDNRGYGMLSETSSTDLVPAYGTAQFANQLLSSIPIPTQPIASVIVARPNGLLVRERTVQSLKATLPVAALLTPDFLGQILRISAQAYAVNDAEVRAGEIIHQKISADLDRVGEAAGHYFSDHTEEETVKLSALREAMPGEKLPDFHDTVANDIEFSRQSDKVDVELTIGHNFTHVFKLTPVQRTAIEANLQKLADASVEYLVAGNQSPFPDTLTEKGFMPKLVPTVGEDYNQVVLSLGTLTLTITTPGGQEISITRDPSSIMQARHRLAEHQIAIERNLAKIDAIAQLFLVANPDESVSFKQLAEKELVSDIKPVADEDYYEELSSISKDQPRISITSYRAGTVTWIRPIPEATQTDFIKRLAEIEQGAAKYFAQNLQAEVVISGELLPPQVVAKALRDEASDASETNERKVPDFTSLVIRRDYKSIKISLENRQVIEVPRSAAK